MNAELVKMNGKLKSQKGGPEGSGAMRVRLMRGLCGTRFLFSVEDEMTKK